MTLSRANLLILDESTNHLDVENIEALEDALEGPVRGMGSRTVALHAK